MQSFSNHFPVGAFIDVMREALKGVRERGDNTLTAKADALEDELDETLAERSPVATRVAQAIYAGIEPDPKDKALDLELWRKVEEIAEAIKELQRER